MLRIILLFLACIGLTHMSLWGQLTENQLDSLEHVIDGSSDLEEKMKIHHQIGVDLFYRDMEKARAHFRDVMSLAHQLDDKEHIAESYTFFGWSFLETSEWDSCQYYINRMINEYDELGREGLKSEAYRIEGVMHSQLGKYGQSIESNKKALEEAKRLEDHSLIASTYNNIAMQFHIQEDHENAKKYYELAIENYLKLEEGDQYLSNILANMSSLETDSTRRLALLDSAIAINLRNRQYQLVGARYIAKSTFYLQKGDAENAYGSAMQAKYYLRNDRTDERFDAHRVLAEALFELGKIDSADYFIDSALIGYEKAFPNLTKVSYELKSKIKERQGDLQGALYYQRQAAVLSDSIYSDKNKELIEEFNSKYDTEEKEKQLVVQQLEIERQQQSQKNLIFGSILALLAVGFVFLVYYNRQRRKKAIAEMALETELKEKAALMELDHMKTQFFTNISHELKTPLTLISGPLDEVVERDGLNESIKSTLVLAQRNSRKLLDLVNEILQLAKLESGQLPINAKPVALDGYLKRLFMSFESFAHTQGVELVYHSNLTGEEVIEIDTDHLERIISNLISNAIKYTPSGGRVSMDLTGQELEDDMMDIQVSVTDTGQGIPSDQLDEIFNRFYQRKETKGQEMGGVGIGLSLASQLTRLLSGELKAESEEGVGSRFALNLKVCKSEIIESPVQEADNYEVNLSDHRNKSLLIVEDNEDMRIYLKGILGGHFKIKMAKDGFDALQILQSESIDLVTSDVMMPKMDGFRLREQMLKMPRLERIPFLFISARSLEEDIMKGFSLGADDYITKPFNAKALLARIENLLNNSEARQRHVLEMGEVEDRSDSILDRFEAIVRRELGNADLKVPDIASELNIGERQLRRITKSETGLSPVGIILEMRLTRARALLESGKFGTVSEVMYQVGINSASYFTKSFSKRFGQSPSEVLIVV